MIESVEIFNFQKHKHLKVEFDKNITTIIGNTDTGKSAIIRAIKWVCLNRPSGNAIIRHGEKTCKVILKINGHEIIRERGRNNLYILDGTEYKAFGSDVPDAVRAATKITEINIQNQFDAFYLFSESDGHVSRQINQIINLDLIDHSMSAINSKIRDKNNQIISSDQNRDTIKNQAVELNWAVHAEKRIDSLCSVQNDIALKRDRIDSMSGLINSIRINARKRVLIRTIASFWSGVVTRHANIVEQKEKIQKLKNTIDAFPQITTIDFSQFDNLVSVRSAIETRGTEYDKLENCVTILEETTPKIETQKTLITELQSKLDAVEVCPLCQQKR